ncbi:hypothetical protein BD311DRAFT_240192 [Dichomitus squalens]|uniref:Uncharacterized protein n=1 Tax=Dichomitus squalens TaxID=114155 RepID=A0A4Q9MUZ3_9APHY|nr:hypothetical protein BD311DRAFT_240192 [Dichomitus squalens]
MGYEDSSAPKRHLSAPDKSQLARAEQASTEPSRDRYGFSNSLTLPSTWSKHGWTLGGHLEACIEYYEG